MAISMKKTTTTTKKNTSALCLAALVFMAALLVPSEARNGFIGCFEPHVSCYPDDCMELCVDNFGKDSYGSCELDPVLNPYSQYDCCCSRKQN